MDLTSSLQGTLDPNTRQQAELYLRQAQEQNLPLFLIALVKELANEDKPAGSRQAAGIYLKNLFDSKEKEKQKVLDSLWTHQSAETKKEIKDNALRVLHSPNRDARKTAAQVIASIGCIEVPRGQWGELVPELVQNITTPKTEQGMEASLMSLGYFCDQCKDVHVQQQSHQILAAVITGMQPTQRNQDIRYFATQALYNALEFVHTNFEKETERNIIMKTVCEATLSEDKRVRTTALQCIVKIAQHYYNFLQPYIQALSQITVKCAKTDEEDVALQAIEFWSTLAEREYENLEANAYSEEIGEEPTRIHYAFINTVLKDLVVLLTELLIRQDENQEDDDWNVSSASGTCLSLIAKVAADAVVPLAMQFISSNINHQDWHFREAATLAFSAILDGPRPSENMSILVNDAIPIMLSHITDAHALVKDTTLFTIGRIAQFHPEPLLNNHLENVLKGLAFALQDQAPNVAGKACWAIHKIAECFEENSDRPTYPLSPYFAILIGALLKTAEREDAEESNLRISAYQAVGSLIQSASIDQHQYLMTLVPTFLQRLQKSLQDFSSALDVKDKEEITIVQGLLCGTLQVLSNKLRDDVKRYADDLMRVYLAILSVKQVRIQEEALLGIGALAEATGDYFVKYMDAFVPFLLNALRSVDEEHICLVAISIVGDLCHGLEAKLNVYSDKIVEVLLTILQHQNKNIKPPIISVFGDIALAIGEQFDRYMKYVGVILKQAAEAQIDPQNDEMVEYLNLLRENIFQAYTGILQGLKSSPRLFDPYVDNLIIFLKMVSKDHTIDEEVFKSSLTVVGDLANVYGSKVKALLNCDEIGSLVKDGLKSSDKATKAIAKATQKELSKI